MPRSTATARRHEMCWVCAVSARWHEIGMHADDFGISVAVRRATLNRACWLRGYEGMGTFSVQLQVGDPSGQRFEAIDAMVDSGATYTVLPASLLERLGVDAHATRRFTLADGSRVERRFGRTWIGIDGKADVSPVVFWDEESLPLLGAVTLEILSLGIDPVNRRLIPVDAFMLPALARPDQSARARPA